MNLSEYQRCAVDTAIYPRTAAVAYPALGLIGELCELREKYEDFAPAAETLKECGDVMWYCANLCNDLGADLESELQKLGFMPLHTDADIKQIAESAKKYVRDGNEMKRSLLLASVRRAAAAVNTISVKFKVPFDSILEANITKLTSRKERGVLQGDGDNR